MLTRSPLIPHVRVRAWDLGTETCTRPLGKGDHVPHDPLHRDRTCSSRRRPRPRGHGQRPCSRRRLRVPGHRRRRAGHGRHADPGAGDGRRSSGAQGAPRRRAAHDVHGRRQDPLDRRAGQRPAARRIRHRACRRPRSRRRSRPAAHPARDARRDARGQHHRPLGQDAPGRPAVPLRRHGVGDRHDRAHDHGRRELRQLARDSSPCWASPCTRRSRTTRTRSS